MAEEQKKIAPLVESSSSVNPTMMEFLQEMADAAKKQSKDKKDDNSK